MKNWTVDDVMTTKVVSVDLGAKYRSVVDTLIENRVSAVPVVDPFLRVTGVVSEADLLRKIEYAGNEAPRTFRTGVLAGDTEEVTVTVEDGAVTLTGEVQLRSTAYQVVRRARQVPGVVEVIDKVGFVVDDSIGYATGIAFGAA